MEKTFNIDFSVRSAVYSSEDCGRDSDSISITSLTINPSSPKVGDIVVIRMQTIVNEAISGRGKGIAAVHLNRVKARSITLSVCELIQGHFPTFPCTAMSRHFEVSRKTKIMHAFPTLDGLIQMIITELLKTRDFFVLGTIWI